MRRSRRLDTLDEEFSVQNLQTYYEQEHPYKYVEPPIYHPVMPCIRNQLMLFSNGIMGSCIVCVWCRNADFNTNTQGISRILSV